MSGGLLHPYFDLLEACDAHEGTVESEQGARLHHVLLSEARVPGRALLFHIAVVGDVCAA